MLTIKNWTYVEFSFLKGNDFESFYDVCGGIIGGHTDHGTLDPVVGANGRREARGRLALSGE